MDMGARNARNDRFMRVLKLRAEKMGFLEIGADLGISRWRAGELHRQAMKWQADDPFEAISTRAKNALFGEGIETRENALAFFTTTPPKPGDIPNLGATCIAEIRHWLNLPE